VQTKFSLREDGHAQSTIAMRDYRCFSKPEIMQKEMSCGKAPAQYLRVQIIKRSQWQLNNSSLLFLFEKKTSIASLFTE
jgi:hypothetical protein